MDNGINSKEELNDAKKKELKNFFEDLKKKNLVKGKTEFCKKIDITPQFFNNMLSGKSKVSDETVFKIKNVYEYDIYNAIFKSNDLESKLKSLGDDSNEAVLTIKIPLLSKLLDKVNAIEHQVREQNKTNLLGKRAQRG